MSTDQTDHRTDPVQEWGPEFGDVIAVVQSRAVSIEDAWAVLAAARPAIEREAKAAAWDEGFTRGFYDVLAGGDRDASESAAENPYRAALATGATTNQEADQ